MKSANKPSTNVHYTNDANTAPTRAPYAYTHISALQYCVRGWLQSARAEPCRHFSTSSVRLHCILFPHQPTCTDGGAVTTTVDTRPRYQSNNFLFTKLHYCHGMHSGWACSNSRLRRGHLNGVASNRQVNGFVCVYAVTHNS